MILDRIVEKKKEEIRLIKQKGIFLPQGYNREQIGPKRGFREALLSHAGVAIIAEAKKASPSKGVICENFNIEEIVKGYENNGAQALSVLTDEQFFQGCLAYMVEARVHVDLPVLRKDFIIDEIQIKEAELCGADAILLIAAILEQQQIAEYFSCACELGMDVLVEVHNEQELEKTLMTDANLIGVNNRNLNDFTVDIETTFRLKDMIPQGIPVVSESGLKDADDLKRLQLKNIDAALIGETLMRAGVNSSVLKELRE